LGAIAGHPNFKWDQLARLGMFNLDGVTCGTKLDAPVGCYARLREASAGKDTTIGHWEIAGLLSPEPLPTFPNGGSAPMPKLSRTIKKIRFAIVFKLLVLYHVLRENKTRTRICVKKHDPLRRSQG